MKLNFKPIQAIQAVRENARKFNDLSADEKSRFSNAILQWQSALYPKTIKTRNWYIGFSIATFALAAYGVITNAWSFSVAVIVAAGVYYYLNQDEPPVIDVVISDVGVKIGGRVYTYGELKTFWVDYQPPHHQALHFVLKNDFKQEITVQIHQQNPSEIRRILTRYLPEWEDRSKTFQESLTHFLGL